MRKILMILCITIMLFGIVGCPSSDEQANRLKTEVYVPGEPVNGTTSPIPEPTSLVLLSTGLFGLAAYGRKRFKK